MTEGQAKQYEVFMKLYEGLGNGAIKNLTKTFKKMLEAELLKKVFQISLMEVKIHDYIDDRNRLSKNRKDLLQKAEKLLADLSLEANSGNELIHLAYGSLKETVISLYDKKR